MIFTGTPVTSDVTVALERNDSGGLGWNLVANPFSATVDFTKLEIDTAMKRLFTEMLELITG